MNATLKTELSLAGDVLKLFKPKGNRLTLLRDLQTTQIRIEEQDGKKIKLTPGGLQVPDSARIVINSGIVQAVGGKCREVKAGQHVVFGGKGTELTINETSFLILRETDLLFSDDPVKPLIPFEDRVLITPDPVAKIIKGIHIPDTVLDQPQSGKVLASNSPEFPLGAQVLFGKFAGCVATYNGHEILVLREADVFAEL